MHGTSETRAKISLHEKDDPLSAFIGMCFQDHPQETLICTEPATLSRLISLVAESTADQT